MWWGTQTACVLVPILLSQVRRNLVVILAMSNVFTSGLKLWILAWELLEDSKYVLFVFIFLRSSISPNLQEEFNACFLNKWQD